MLLFIQGHLPPEVPQLWVLEKEVRKSKIDLPRKPLDLGESLQRIESRLRIHNLYFYPFSNLRLKNSRISTCFSESRIIDCKSSTKTP